SSHHLAAYVSGFLLVYSACCSGSWSNLPALGFNLHYSFHLLLYWVKPFHCRRVAPMVEGLPRCSRADGVRCRLCSQTELASSRFVCGFCRREHRAPASVCYMEAQTGSLPRCQPARRHCRSRWARRGGRIWPGCLPFRTVRLSAGSLCDALRPPVSSVLPRRLLAFRKQPVGARIAHYAGVPFSG